MENSEIIAIAKELKLNETLIEKLNESLQTKKISEPMQNLIDYLEATPKLHNQYRELGISDEIFYDTLSDLSVWCENYHNETGDYGITEKRFLIKHYSLNLFKLGRLQFEKTRIPFDYKNIKALDDVLAVHIQQGAPLIKEEYSKSFERAVPFFNKLGFFPKAFVTHSWLLWDGLKEFLPENSNIVTFAKNFTVLQVDESNDALDYIFGRGTSKEEIKKMEGRNSMEKGLIKLVKENKQTYACYGIILI